MMNQIIIPLGFVCINSFGRDCNWYDVLLFKAQCFHHFYSDGIFGMNGTFGTQFLAAETADTCIMINGYYGFGLNKADALGWTGFHAYSAAFTQVLVNKGFDRAKRPYYPEKRPENKRALNRHG